MTAYRASGVGVVAVVFAALLPLSTVRAATEIPVLTSTAGEFQPSRGPNHLAWEQNTKGQPNHYNVIVQADGGEPTRVNPGRSNAAMGGIDGDRLVYQQFRKGASDLFIYELDTGVRSRLPKQVNSKMWEYWPSLSGPWLLYARWKKSNDSRRLYLNNLETGERRILHRTRGQRAFVDPGQVNGDYAVWSRCPPKGRCHVYRYQISSATRVKLPNPGSFQRAPSVNPHGTVFYSRGSKGCGGGVRLVQFGSDGEETILTQFPEGLDSRDTFAFTDESGITHVYYERFGCGKRTGSDIFKVKDSEVAGSITVIKDARPSHAQDFSFVTTGGLSPATFSLDDDADGALSNEIAFTGLPSGTYTVTESPIPAGWQPTDLVCTGGGSNTSPAGPTAVIGLDVGENVICTFSNAKEGSITVIKDAVPNDPQDFRFHPSSNLGPADVFLDDDADGSLPREVTFPNLPPGMYSVSEVGIDEGWTLTGIQCVGGGSNTSFDLDTSTANIGLDLGEAVVCTFENTKEGSITVIKDALPDGPQDFGFTATGLAPSAFSLDDDADPTLSRQRVFSGLLPGTYEVSEDADSAGWQLTDISCVGGGTNTSDTGRTAAIGLDPGEQVTCTFANTELGSITIRKDAVPNAPRDFEFDPSAGLDSGPNLFLDDDTNQTLSNESVYEGVFPGTYTVREVNIHEDWTLTGVLCIGGGLNTTTSTFTATATIGLDPGENVTCTFTNTEEGSITIVKDAVDDSAQDFGFTATGLAPSAFSLDDDADPTLSRQRVFSGLLPGAYEVSEDADPTGWKLTDISCVGGGPNTSDTDRTATIGLDPGENVTCTFTNTEEGSITIVEDVTGVDPLGQDFEFDPSDNLQLANFLLDDDDDPTLSSTKAFLALLPGTYSVSQVSIPLLFPLQALDCVGGGPNTTTSTVSAAATIGLDPGETVVCRFQNSAL